MPNLRHTPPETKPPTGATGQNLPISAPPASTVAISVQEPIANPSTVSAPIQTGLQRIAPEHRQQLSPPLDSLRQQLNNGRLPLEGDPLRPMNVVRNSPMPDVTHPPPGTAAAPETAAQPAARNIPQAITPVTIPEDGEEINLRLSAAFLKDYCYRFVKDGRHLTPNRLSHFGQLREVVEEVPALKGWAVRVPRNMERERFERHFACGRFAQSRQAPEYTYLSNIASSLSSMENIVQRGFTPNRCTSSFSQRKPDSSGNCQPIDHSKAYFFV